ncbi:xylulokinase XylB [Butyrivibrio proteoclasticus B316]|uniref:Xylulose kinase n=1 Tax=Butyrivibrio proteoclasticus (strain ATCC 51982 / DSM 14932 / B316) TaxID=515622 RepID=E0RW57_BUTPB|nr:xylulokinase [Butyrivibrio proteoclasticus]ADL32923.1 xylulokinase XylB [Butyrivibrio proteoclasticus B316]
MLYIGVDLGTSSVKLVLMDETGKIHGTVTKEYPLYFPQPGWSEQKPEDWYTQAIAGLKELLENVDKSQVAGISFGGQMHGLVILDENDEVIRPAILWNDGRTQKQVDYLNNEIGKETLSKYTANIAFAGFTAPKILWVKENEPENFKRIKKIMLPKDYLAYKLSGTFCTDYSDASGMLLLDVQNRKWSKEMCDICGITEDLLPTLYDSSEKVGQLKAELAKELGLSENVVIAAGAGDNAAAAVGTGTVGNNKCNISLGTSGTIFMSSDNFAVDSNNALHSFDHADGHFHLMGCMLSAASCNKWWNDEILKTKDYAAEQKGIEKLGENHVFFLPYLMGERSPWNNPNARATFTGITMDTTREDMTQAVLEGVAFATRDMYEVAKSIGVAPKRTMICGGGAKSPLWRKMIANILNVEVDVPVCEEGPGMGGAMLAMVACGAYKSVEEAAAAIVKVDKTEKPDPELVAKYEARYQQFKTIYPALKETFDKII